MKIQKKIFELPPPGNPYEYLREPQHTLGTAYPRLPQMNPNKAGIPENKLLGLGMVLVCSRGMLENS